MGCWLQRVDQISNYIKDKGSHTSHYLRRDL